MQVVIKVQGASVQVVDNSGYTVLDAKVEKYEVDASVEALSDAILDMVSHVLSIQEQDND